MTPSDPTTNVPADSSAPATDAAPTQPTEEPVAPAESSTAPPVESTAPAEPTAEGAAPAEASNPHAHRGRAVPARREAGSS